jgi:eukaryotic-like serine/threonine-protein kinase
MALAPDDRLGPYVIQALLGAGGMGEVYRGFDTRLGRDVALKVISPRLVGDAASRKRFETEARAASALNHPAIVTIYDVGESEGVSWIAMEWVEGRVLRSVLAEGPLPIAEAWSIAKQLAAGLSAAHAKGIVHRDLKPENVMLTADGRAKILDFGLARQFTVDVPDDSALETTTGATFAGSILGTAGYMSPEQASGRVADFRSDQFSLGVVIYELITGRRAFSRPTAVETLSATIRENPEHLSQLCAGVSEAFHRVIDRCLAKRPEDRFASTRDLASTLESLNPVSGGSSGTNTLAETKTGVEIYPAAPVMRRRAWAVGIAGVALVALALAAGVWNRFGAAITSVAVLPFENTAQDPDVDYLGDGLTESLIDHLSRVQSLTVMARGSVMRFKDSGDPLGAGRTLGVGAVVSGTVTRRDDQVIISAELIDTATGERLWGGIFDRPMAELFRVQDSLVSSISTGLRLRLTGQDQQRLAGYGTESVEAYELYLKGLHFFYEDTEGGDLEALKLFQQAVGKDPKFVNAIVGISSVYARQAGNGYAPPKEALARAAEEIQKVTAIDPDNLAVRNAVVANRFFRTYDWAAAERDYRALLEEPGFFQSIHYHPVALFFIAIGRPDEAVAIMERGLASDPGNTESRVMLGTFLAQAGRLDDAMKVYTAIIESEPRDPRPHFGAADVYRRRGDIPRAFESRHTAYELSGEEDAARVFASGRTEEDFEKAEIAVARIRLRELEGAASVRFVSQLDFARQYAVIGDRERAIPALERAVEEKPIGLILLKVDQAWDRIRTDPRFAAIVRRIGIP